MTMNFGLGLSHLLLSPQAQVLCPSPNPCVETEEFNGKEWVKFEPLQYNVAEGSPVLFKDPHDGREFFMSVSGEIGKQSRTAEDIMNSQPKTGDSNMLLDRVAKVIRTFDETLDRNVIMDGEWYKSLTSVIRSRKGVPSSILIHLDGPDISCFEMVYPIKCIPDLVEGLQKSVENHLSQDFFYRMSYQKCWRATKTVTSTIISYVKSQDEFFFEHNNEGSDGDKGFSAFQCTLDDLKVILSALKETQELITVMEKNKNDGAATGTGDTQKS